MFFSPVACSGAMYWGVPRESPVRVESAAAGLGHSERDAEVGHQRMAALKQDVLGFDIAVDDAVLVGVFEGVGRLGRDPNDVGDGKLAFPDEPMAEGLALYVRHHIVEETVG